MVNQHDIRNLNGNIILLTGLNLSRKRSLYRLMKIITVVLPGLKRLAIVESEQRKAQGFTFLMVFKLPVILCLIGDLLLIFKN